MQLTSGCRELDVLAAGAYDGTRLVGLAGCSADCDTMWQIGIDVLPEYRRQGIASALTSRLALEILAAGRGPVLLCGLGKCEIGEKCRTVRLYPGLGGA